MLIKPFKHKGEEVATVLYWQKLPQEGGNDLRISLDSPWDALKPREARRLAEWLLKAADAADMEMGK